MSLLQILITPTVVTAEGQLCSLLLYLLLCFVITAGCRLVFRRQSPTHMNVELCVSVYHSKSEAQLASGQSESPQQYTSILPLCAQTCPGGWNPRPPHSPGRCSARFRTTGGWSSHSAEQGATGGEETIAADRRLCNVLMLH